MKFNEPSSDQITALKDKYPNRSLHLVEMVDVEGKTATDDDDVYCFVMTGPSKEEFKKYTDEIMSAKEKAKTEADKIDGINGAIERAALAMIRHPDRDEVKRLFDFKPLLAQGFAAEISKAAGDNFEVRSRKL